jgi:RNA polymerase sigma factor (sigma-70 family)
VEGAQVAELVGQAAGGDGRAYEALVQRFTPLVWAVARSFRLSHADASDVSQVVWLRFVENLNRIREPDRAGAWLATTARRECLAVIRRSGRTIVVGTEMDPFLDEAPDPVDRRMLAEERDLVLARAVGSMPERCRQLLRLLFSDPPPSYEEISASLDLPIGSIGPTRQRCLDRLRNHPEIARITASSPDS